MGLDGGPKTDYKLLDELRAPIMPDCGVGSYHRETGSEGMKLEGLGIDLGDEVAI